ncbi:MAG TPA: tyrosine-type recombinase/integrase [Bacilli bacterium]|nr:tyrosine-type recombinase/integrase [Bacilli bacterium]
MKFKQAFNQYMIYVKSMKSKGTYDCYRSHQTFILKELGNVELKKINQKLLLSYIDKRKINNPKIKNVTINKELKLIRQVYKYILGIPLNITLLSETKITIQTVSKETFVKILTHLESKLTNKLAFRNYIYIRLLIETGLRLNEINNILIRNINFDENSILVEITKTDENRYVFFLDDTAKLLQEYVQKYQQNEYLFIDFNTGNVLSTSAVENMLRRLRKRLNIDTSISPHKWRHTFATKFARNNGNMEALRMLMGHSNLKTTQKYIHLNKDDLRQSYYSAVSPTF